MVTRFIREAYRNNACRGRVLATDRSLTGSFPPLATLLTATIGVVYWGRVVLALQIARRPNSLPKIEPNYRIIELLKDRKG